MKYLLWGIVFVAALAVVAAGGFYLYGPERLWTSIGGPADQGPISFARLKRSPTPNDALACSPGACSGDGVVDVALPFYAADPATLLSRLDASLASDPDITRVDDGSRPNYRRYVARTRIMRFPDTIDVETDDATGSVEGTVLRMYSRSLLGKGDLGANRKRLEAWAKSLGSGAGSIG